MRTVKEAAVRRNEILDCAQRLFVQKGYDKTSTNDILNEIGIARGTLYYHFQSKEEILNALIDRMSSNLLEKAQAIAHQRDLPVLQRLTLCIMALDAGDHLGQEIMEQVHKPQNALMHQKMQDALLRQITPMFSSLIQEAAEQGICSTRYPDEAAEMTLMYSMNVFDELNTDGPEIRQKKILAFIYHLERILAMPEGSLCEVILPVFQKKAEDSD